MIIVLISQKFGWGAIPIEGAIALTGPYGSYGLESILHY